jgi:GNAT superfamily N-acetyltransferase
MDPHDHISAIEAIEQAACADMYAAAPANVADKLGLAYCRIDDGLLLINRRLDNLVFNRLVGFGVKMPVREASIDQAIRAFQGAGIHSWVIQVAPGTAVLSRVLAARGFSQHPRTWAKFVRPPEPIAVAPTDLTVREIGCEEADCFGAVAAEGFGLPRDAADWVAAIVGRPRWRCFLAIDGTQAVAGGAAFIDGKSAWLGLGATVPSHRGRGAQSALLTARLTATAGAEVVTTETGVPLNGEASPSYNNIQRAGFKLAYQRPNFRHPNPATAAV